MKKSTLRHTPLRILLLMITVFAVNIGIIQISKAMATSHTIIRGSSFVIGNLRYFKLADDANGVAVAWAGNTDIDTLFSSSESVESVDISIPSSSWNLDVDTSITHSEINDAPSEKEDINAPLPKLAIDAQVSYVDKTYTVKAVAPSGFRFCTFSSITLPQTIDEIGKEAFYCCTNLTEIQLPIGITAISDSCFMDCRSLTNVYFSKNDGGRTNVNSAITSIGNHAFTNCISLVGFNCPTSLTSIGTAAFQKCSKMMSFFFPSKNAVAFTNEISVGDYAFSDCGSMTLCYFEENLVSVGKFAFAQCDKLMLYYTGSTVPNLGENWRKKHVATDKTSNNETYTNSGGTSVYVPGQLSDDYVPININNGVIKSDNRYPGLYFTIQSTDIKINCTTTKNINLKANPGDYASIFKFDTPDRDESGYYTVSTGALTIPANVKVGDTDYPVKVIQTNAFARNEDLKNLSFAESSNLLQICHHAFVGCANLASIDFSNANSLEEISYQVFQAEDADTNTSLKGTLTMPSNLKYLGYRSFYNFKNATNLSLNSTLQFIGEDAFANYGASTSGGACNLILPTSLNDKKAEDVEPYKKNGNNFAVMYKAFYNAKALKTVTIASIPNDWNGNTNFSSGTNRISIHNFSFGNCTKLLQFKGSPRLYRIAGAAFEGSANMRELLLTTICANDSSISIPYPWGWVGGDKTQSSIFDNNLSVENNSYYSFPDLVIYIRESNNPKDPKSSGNPFGQEGYKWNSDQGLINMFTSNRDRLFRRTVPTYYGVDWHANEIKYAELENNSNTYQIKSGDPLSAPNWDQDMVAYINNGTGNTITHCYVNEDRDVIDLSTNSFAANIIGECAFTNGAKYPGKRIKLPNGVTEIKERAFYRTDGKGVTDIAKYDESITDNGTCSLPILTRLERLAFYNNSFASIKIAGTGLAFLGNSVFICESSVAKIASIEFSGSANFEVINNGIYYKGASGKTLLYQAAKGSGTDPSSLTISEGTVAIGPKALARASYTTITIPSTVTTIYGTAFAGSFNTENTSLTEIIFDGTPSLTHIGATVQLPNSDGDDYPIDYDVLDGGFFDGNHGSSYGKHLPTSSAFGPFYKCTSLTTFNFSALTSLERITYGAFQSCSNLIYMTGGADKIEYYRYKEGTKSNLDWTKQAEERPNSTSDNQGILDLSNCLNLKSIARYAFGECSLIKYVHLPEFTLNEYSSPVFCMGYDPTEDFSSFSKANMGGSTVFNAIANNYKIFVGEKASIAYWTGGSSIDNTSNNTGRYPKGRAFPTSHSNIYFYVDGGDGDLMNNKNVDIRYWTKKDGKYLLFDGKSGNKPYEEVQAYFAS